MLLLSGTFLLYRLVLATLRVGWRKVTVTSALPRGVVVYCHKFLQQGKVTSMDPFAEYVEVEWDDGVVSNVSRYCLRCKDGNEETKLEVGIATPAPTKTKKKVRFSQVVQPTIPWERTVSILFSSLHNDDSRDAFFGNQAAPLQDETNASDGKQHQNHGAEDPILSEEGLSMEVAQAFPNKLEIVEEIAQDMKTVLEIPRDVVVQHLQEDETVEEQNHGNLGALENENATKNQLTVSSSVDPAKEGNDQHIDVMVVNAGEEASVREGTNQEQQEQQLQQRDNSKLQHQQDNVDKEYDTNTKVKHNKVGTNHQHIEESYTGDTNSSILVPVEENNQKRLQQHINELFVPIGAEPPKKLNHRKQEQQELIQKQEEDLMACRSEIKAKKRDLEQRTRKEHLLEELAHVPHRMEVTFPASSSNFMESDDYRFIIPLSCNVLPQTKHVSIALYQLITGGRLEWAMNVNDHVPVSDHTFTYDIVLPSECLHLSPNTRWKIIVKDSEMPFLSSQSGLFLLSQHKDRTKGIIPDATSNDVDNENVQEEMITSTPTKSSSAGISLFHLGAMTEDDEEESGGEESNSHLDDLGDSDLLREDPFVETPTEMMIGDVLDINWDVRCWGEDVSVMLSLWCIDGDVPQHIVHLLNHGASSGYYSWRVPASHPQIRDGAQFVVTLESMDHDNKDFRVASSEIMVIAPID
eukprot:m.81899 g.81899  ORF g.81899 m.81899 type:complete len:694 (-) comp8659_c0_seq1:2287-4368(-)